MINAIYNAGVNGLLNSQTCLNISTNNITNADVAGYKKQSPVYQTADTITHQGVTVGTGAELAGVEASINYFVEQQYLATSAEAAKCNQQVSYQTMLESTLAQSEDSGLGSSLSTLLSAWGTLATDPTQPGAWEEVLGAGQGLASTYNNTYAQMKAIEQSLEQEMDAQISEANTLLDEIAQLNAQVAANADDLQAVDARDQAIRELAMYMDVRTEFQEDGTVTILAEGQFTLVEGRQANKLSSQPPQSRESLMPASTYDGDVAFSGSSSEELTLEFINDTQYYASLDGGKTWVTDEAGAPVVYDAGDADSPETIAGVDIWFTDDGATSHTAGDRYIVSPKSSLYLENGSGTFLDITPLTDGQGTAQSGRATSGSLAGLYMTRDDNVVPAMEKLDALANSVIWEMNTLHSKGAGLEHHTELSGSYQAEKTSVSLAESGLPYADKLQSGDVSFVVYDADGNALDPITVAIDPTTDSLESIATQIQDASAGDMTATVSAEGTLTLAAASGMSFEVAEDGANLMAGLGLNTFFTGFSASTITVNEYVVANPQHINAGSADSNGTVTSGDNAVALTLADLTNESVNITCNGIAYTETLSSFSSLLVSEVGADVAMAEQQQVYATATNEYYYEYQLSETGVNVDEEQVNLIKYQQQYAACSKVITAARDMLDEVAGYALGGCNAYRNISNIYCVS